MRPELHGKVGVLSEMTHTMGHIMLSEGVGTAGDWGDDEFQRGIDFLDEHLRSGELSKVSGATYFLDSFMVPNGREKRELVQQLIDYYHQPELADNPLVFPDDETNSRLTQIRLLSSAEDKKYTTSFTKVLGL